MINGIVVQNNPLKYIDPEGLVAREALLGDFSNKETTWTGVGAQVALGLTPAGVLADVRDIAANATKIYDNPNSLSAWGGLGAAIVGVVPLAGDFIKGALKVGKRATVKTSTNLLESATKSGARFNVTPDGVAIPANPSELIENLNKLQDVSANPSTSRKFVGIDSKGSVRVRVEKGHSADPDFTGTPDPLHTVDHLHIDRRRNIDSGPWGSKEKVPYEWPFGE